MKILIVDDKQKNLDLAKAQLGSVKNLELTYVSTFRGAIEYLRRVEFDAVFTDCMLPGEADGISSTNPEIGKDTPYGLVLTIVAKNMNVLAISIVTDLGHHSGPIPWALDQIINTVNSGNEIQCIQEKNWLMAYKSWFGEPEIHTVSHEVENSRLLVIGAPSQEFLNKEIFKNFEIFYSEKSDDEIVSIFSEKKPTHVVIIGEFGVSGPTSCEKSYDLIKALNVSIGKVRVVVSGFQEKPSNYSDLNYIRLPWASEDLLRMLKD